jgi:hypothetical protein
LFAFLNSSGIEALENPFNDDSVCPSISPENATIALYGILFSFKYLSNAFLYFTAFLRLLVTIIALASPLIFFLPTTALLKCSTITAVFRAMFSS